MIAIYAGRSKIPESNIHIYIYLMAKVPASKTPVKNKTGFWQNDKLIAALLAALAFILYANTIGHDFVLDDVAVIKGNAHVQAGPGGMGDILSTFYWHGYGPYASSNSGIFRPASLLLFNVEWMFAPESTRFFHLVQVLLYALCAYQLYRLLRSLFREQSQTLPLIATLLWIVMPVHTEVVANIKSGDETLCMLFFLLSFRHLLNWADNGKINSLIYSAAAIFLSLLSKEGGALFLPVMLLGLVMFRRKKIKDLILPGIVLAVVSFIWLGWHIAVINAGPEPVEYDYRHNALLSSDSRIDQLGTAIGMQALYWQKILFGYPLSYNYSFNQIPVDGFSGIWCWISLIGIAGSAFFAWKNFRSNPILSFGILYYFITFALTCNIFFLIGDIFAERFTFAPSLGCAIISGWIILKLTKGLSEKSIQGKALTITIGIGFIYSALTFSRSSDWVNEKTLYTVDAEHSPNSGRARGNYGVLLLNPALGMTDGAERRSLLDRAYTEYKAAWDIDSLDFGAAQALGQIEYHRKNYAASANWSRKSIAAFRTMAIKTKAPLTENWQVLENLGDALMLDGKYDSAYNAFDRAIAANPKNDGSVIKLSGAYLANKDTAHAIEALINATKLNPESVKAWDKLGNLYGMTKHFDKSKEAFLKITELQPADAHGWQMLATSCLMLGDTANARKYSEEYRKRGGK